MKKLIIVLILAALFFGCKNDASSSSTTKTYTVTIDPNGGTLEQKTYTVEEGKTFTIPTAPSPAVAYYKVKDYINTADNSPFTMGTTAVNGDITLKVEWVVDLYVVRDMMTVSGGKWTDGKKTLVFRNVSATSLALKLDYTSGYYTALDQESVLSISDRNDMIANITILSTGLDHIKTITDTSMILYTSSLAGGDVAISETTFTKVTQ